MLINSPPQVGSSAVDREKNFIEIPCVARLWATAAQLIGVLLPERERPPTDGFVAQYTTTRCHQFFDIAKAPGNAVGAPDRVANAFRWVPVAFVGWGKWRCLHAHSIAHVAVSSNTRRLL